MDPLVYIFLLAILAILCNMIQSLFGYIRLSVLGISLELNSKITATLKSPEKNYKSDVCWCQA